MDDILTNISDLFLGNGIIIVLGCLIVGTFLKGSINKLPNKFIPYINACVAVILGFIIPGTFEDEPVVSKVILLVFLGLSSTGLYEALCTIIKDRFSIDIKKICNNIINPDKNDAPSQTQEDVPQTSIDEENNDDLEG